MRSDVAWSQVLTREALTREEDKGSLSFAA